MYNIKFIPHTADIAVKIIASDLEELFKGSSEAWLQTVVNVEGTEANLTLKIHLTGNSLEELLVNFLSELNYLLEIKKYIFHSVEHINIEKKGNSFNLYGKINISPYNKAFHLLKEEVKAVTYHKMNIKKEKGNYSTRIIFDI